MTKIEEILCNRFFVEPSKLTDNEDGICAKLEYEVHRSQHLPSRLIDAIKEYAELYAKRVLEIAAGEACETDGFTRDNIDQDSILNIKLPEHE